ncbi:MAG: hypothetical protein WA418_02620 [Bradyrhizobium sp.]
MLLFAGELAAAGLLRSPLHWNALVFALMAEVIRISTIRQQSPIVSFLWLAAIAVIVILLGLRRALKWRYPI